MRSSAPTRPFRDVQYSNTGSSLTTRALWLLSAKILAFAFAFALPVLLTRTLSQSEYGVFKQIFLVVGTATSVLPLGLGMSAYYYLPREHDAVRRGQIIFNILLFTGLVGGSTCLLLVLSPELLATAFRQPMLVSFAPLVGVVILLWLFSSVMEAIVVANQELRMATVFIVCAQLSKTVLMLSAALVFDTVESLVYAALVQGMLQTMALLWYLRLRFPRFWTSFDWQVMRLQVGYSVPFGLAGLLYTLQMDLHNYFVSNRFNAATFAVYSIGVAQLPLVGMMRESVGAVMLPRVSYLQKHGEVREIVLLLARAMRKLAAVFLPLYAFMMVTGREFLTVMFTAAYVKSWPIFAINLTLLPLALLEFDAVVRSYQERRFFILKLRVALFVLGILGLWFGIFYFGLVGAIGVVVAINFIERVAIAIKFNSILGITRRDLMLLKDVAKLGVAAFSAGLVTLLVHSFITAAQPLVILLVCGLIFALVYITAILVLRVPTSEERLGLRHGIERLYQRAHPRRAATSLGE